MEWMQMMVKMFIWILCVSKKICDAQNGSGFVNMQIIKFIWRFCFIENPFSRVSCSLNIQVQSKIESESVICVLFLYIIKYGQWSGLLNVEILRKEHVDKVEKMSYKKRKIQKLK